jgi:subtilisin family serine protease
MSKMIAALFLLMLLVTEHNNFHRELIDSGDMNTVIVVLKDQVSKDTLENMVSELPTGSRQERVVRTLQSKAEDSQKDIKAWLASSKFSGQIGQVISFWIFNGLAVTATLEVVAELEQRVDVASVIPDNVIQVPDFSPDFHSVNNPPEENITLINAPVLWSMGLRGQNVVVANMDTGVNIQHPDLASHWRGGTNSWFDPYGEHPTTPTDNNGHGTWTMGVMVGKDYGGTAIGVAPEAKWIAVKIFNDHDQATSVGIHLGYQWILDPDGNPATADAPQVLNNSWDYGVIGCNLTFQADLNALRAAGILPVFAAGNYGEFEPSDVSPANNPGAFAVGAVNNQDQILSYSSRGPTSCGGYSDVYPLLVAPGSTIRTADLGQFYTTVSGTSLAAPHVAGGLAILLSAFPGLPLSFQEQALQYGVLDLGDPGPDNTYGYGRLDLLASYQWLMENYYPLLERVYLPTIEKEPSPLLQIYLPIVFKDG